MPSQAACPASATHLCLHQPPPQLLVLLQQRADELAASGRDRLLLRPRPLLPLLRRRVLGRLARAGCAAALPHMVHRLHCVARPPRHLPLPATSRGGQQLALQLSALHPQCLGLAPRRCQLLPVSLGCLLGRRQPSHSSQQRVCVGPGGRRRPFAPASLPLLLQAQCRERAVQLPLQLLQRVQLLGQLQLGGAQAAAVAGRLGARRLQRLGLRDIRRASA